VCAGRHDTAPCARPEGADAPGLVHVSDGVVGLGTVGTDAAMRGQIE